MFVTRYMKEWVEGMFLANFFFSETAQFSASSRGQAQPLPLLNFIYFNSGHSCRLARLLCVLVLKHWESPATWNHWLDFTDFFPIHCLSHSQTCWVILRRVHLSIPSSAWLLICVWKAEGIMIQIGILSQFWDLTLKIITYLTLNICSLP